MTRPRLRVKLLEHRGRDVDAVHAHAALCERNRNPAAADGELERAAGSQRRQEVDGRADDLRGEHRIRFIHHPERFSFPCFFAYRSPTLNTESPIGIENAPITSSGHTSAQARPAPFRICSRLPRSA